MAWEQLLASEARTLGELRPAEPHEDMKAQEIASLARARHDAR